MEGSCVASDQHLLSEFRNIHFQVVHWGVFCS